MAAGVLRVPPSSATFDRIASDPGILGGKPVVRGTRIGVETVLDWVASGAARDDVLRRHPHLTAADVEQALAHAAATGRDPEATANDESD